MFGEQESQIEQRSDSDAEFCTLPNLEGFTVSSAYGTLIPTFSSFDIYLANEVLLDSIYNDTCITSQSFIDFAIEEGFTSSWIDKVSSGELVDVNLNMPEKIDPVTMSLMDEFGFTMIGDSLYHWMSDSEIYSIGVNQPEAYSYLVSLGTETASAEKLFKHKIRIFDSDIRYYSQAMMCDQNSQYHVAVFSGLDQGCIDGEANGDRVFFIAAAHSVSFVYGDIIWGDGTVDHISFPGGQGRFFRHSYSAQGVFDFEVDLDYSVVNVVCPVNNLVGRFKVGANQCTNEWNDRNRSYRANGDTNHWSSWPVGSVGAFITLEKKRTPGGSKLIGSTYYGIVRSSTNGNTFVGDSRAFTVSLHANWRNDNCDVHDVDFNSETGASFGVRRIVVRPSKRRFKYYYQADMSIRDVSTRNLSGTPVTMDNTLYFVVDQCN